MRTFVFISLLFFFHNAFAEDFALKCIGDKREVWNKCYSLDAVVTPAPYNSTIKDTYYEYREWQSGKASLYASIIGDGFIKSYQKYNSDGTINKRVVVFNVNNGSISFINQYADDGTFINVLTALKNPQEIDVLKDQIYAEKSIIENKFKKIAPPEVMARIKQQVVPETKAPSAVPTAPVSSTSLDEVKNKCKELGFQEKTEAFGRCVLRLSK